MRDMLTLVECSALAFISPNIAQKVISMFMGLAAESVAHHTKTNHVIHVHGEFFETSSLNNDGF